MRAAFWLGITLVNRGEMARGGGWLARARRVLDEAHEDGVERGYLLVPDALRSLGEGDPAAADVTFSRVAEIAEQSRDPDLLTLARLGRGQALVDQGKPRDGVILLDEAMVAVTAGEVSPIVVGIVYCAVIDSCQAIFDVRRAQEWTAALSRWCEAQPDLVPYRGRCLLYRTELLRLHGAWPEAEQEARRAHDHLSRPPAEPTLGEAHYQRAELLRLRGAFAEAEAAYRAASQWGRPPEPGFALLRLAQGQLAAAQASISRALDEARDPAVRARLLEPSVDIFLAVGDRPAARRAADELARIAARFGAPLLSAMAASAEGAVLLAEGDARAALTALRRGWTVWHELQAPYEAARTRVQIGLACQAVGDVDAATMEFDAARRVFDELGARPELARLGGLSGGGPAPSAGGLTARELEVLRLVAAGKTNRAIAADLVLSEKTIARHVSNIFGKLGLSSRAAATAYAYEHRLV